MRAKKHYGQNFLKDDFVLESITNALSSTQKDLIIEIGPGKGALTQKLKKKNARLIAYEIDTDLRPYLNKLVDDNTTIIYQDILTSNIKEDIKEINYENLYFVGNLPYYITTPIIEYITNLNLDFKSLIIMVQKEVADRFLANEKSKEYGYFTLYLKYFYDSEKITDVSKNSFEPVPKVNSSVIKLTKKENRVLEEKKYFDFLKKCFKEKRKTLKNNLKDYDFDVIKKVLLKNNYSELVRAEEITEEVFIEIFQTLNI